MDHTFTYDFAHLLAVDAGQAAHTVELVRTTDLPSWLAAQPDGVAALAHSHSFTGRADTYLILPKDDGWNVVAVVEDTLGPWSLAALAKHLPAGRYRLTDACAGDAALGWLLAQHDFQRYRSDRKAGARRILITDTFEANQSAVRMAEAVAMTRDLINTPANDLGPAELQEAFRDLAARHDATVSITDGDALAEQFPLIHVVGKAAPPDRAPRLLELEWGEPHHPRIAVVGKGVCFDTGGLDIKSGSGMLLMKKDMGGAAHALALAGLIMAAGLHVRLHLLIPVVENAIAANAMRPGDIVKARTGLFVEIGNTDAEGRLILADAIARAGEAAPALVIDFATLTSAARVALGPDLPAFFCNDDVLAGEFASAAAAAVDPVWRLPLWQPYIDLIRSSTADITNAGESGFARAITAALFIELFVPEGIRWLHLDTYAWQPLDKPGRPRGGDALGLRAVWAMLCRGYSSDVTHGDGLSTEVPDGSQLDASSQEG